VGGVSNLAGARNGDMESQFGDAALSLFRICVQLDSVQAELKAVSSFRRLAWIYVARLIFGTLNFSLRGRTCLSVVGGLSTFPLGCILEMELLLSR
jgi:hypothetical protein